MCQCPVRGYHLEVVEEGDLTPRTMAPARLGDIYEPSTASSAAPSTDPRPSGR